MTFKADLHTHTICSDGALSPEELITRAAAEGVQGLAITDHDTVDAYPQAFSLAADHNLPLLPGIELSCSFEGRSVHILGYAIDTTSDALVTSCSNALAKRRQRIHDMVALLAKGGYDITAEEVLDAGGHIGSVGRPHIAQILIKKGYVSSVKEAFNKLLSNKSRYYLPSYTLSAEEGIDLIHQAQGLAILAHPHVYFSKHNMKRLLALPFDGIEGYYCAFPYHKNSPWVREGEKRNWIITGGSDFHGESIKPLALLGSAWTNEATFRHLMDHYLAHTPCLK